MLLYLLWRLKTEDRRGRLGNKAGWILAGTCGEWWAFCSTLLRLKQAKKLPPPPPLHPPKVPLVRPAMILLGKSPHDSLLFTSTEQSKRRGEKMAERQRENRSVSWQHPNMAAKILVLPAGLCSSWKRETATCYMEWMIMPVLAAWHFGHGIMETFEHPQELVGCASSIRFCLGSLGRFWFVEKT